MCRAYFRTILGLIVLTLCSITSAASAQPQLPSADSLLQAYGNANRSEESTKARLFTGFILRNADRFDTPMADSLLNGLESIATSHPDEIVRRRAMVDLALAGAASSSSPARGNVARLVRIFSGTTDRYQRIMLVQQPLQIQHERTAAVRFLREVATGRTGDDPRLAIHAVRTLTMMGEEGRAVLRELLATGGAATAEARRHLEELAERDFRVVPPGQPPRP